MKHRTSTLVSLPVMFLALSSAARALDDVQPATATPPETVLVIDPSKQNARNSEGDIIELKDGRLCLVYSRFGASGTDTSKSDLAMRTSNDGGKTWSDDRLLLPNEGKVNVMSVSMLRLKNGELLLFYLRKDSRTSYHLYLRRSNDEFQTLSRPVRVTLLDGYHVVNNDRVIQTSTGRLIVPANLHIEIDDEGNNISTQYQSLAVPFVYYSDDEGCGGPPIFARARSCRNTLN